MARSKPTSAPVADANTAVGESMLALREAIRSAAQAVQPEQCYVVNGQARSLEFGNGTVVELHDNRPAVVIMVLGADRVRGLPVGTFDVTEL